MKGRQRIHSLYLDELEQHAVLAVADANHTSPNAVCRALIRKALGLPALELRLPDEVREWAERRQAADAAGRALTR